MMLDEDIWDNTKQFDYLFECARKKGLTTAVAIAEESGVDANTISRLKTGRQKSPDLIQVVKLYKACGASLDYGFGIESGDTDKLQNELEKLKYENERLNTELAAKEQLVAANKDALQNARKVLFQRSQLITGQADNHSDTRACHSRRADIRQAQSEHRLVPRHTAAFHR